MRLKDKVAVVVGGGRGIGEAVCLELARQGANVVVVDPGGSREGLPDESKPAQLVADKCRALGVSALACNEDASDFAASGAVVTDTVAKFGRLDILVNTAGVLRERMIWNMTEDDWDLVLKVHLKSCFNYCHHVSRVMREKQDGRIVLMCSSAWLQTMGQSNYGAAKGAIWSLTRALARELGGYGVTVNSLCPTAATRMTMDEKVKAGFKKRLERGIITQARYEALMNMGGPEIIAPLVAWLCTDAAADINGQNFRILEGRISVYQEPFEKASLLKTEDNGIFTLDELDSGMPSLMTGIPNPMPRRPAESAS